MLIMKILKILTTRMMKMTKKMMISMLVHLVNKNMMLSQSLNQSGKETS